MAIEWVLPDGSVINEVDDIEWVLPNGSIVNEQDAVGGVTVLITKGLISTTANSLFGNDIFKDLTPGSVAITGLLTGIAQALGIDSGSIAITKQNFNVNLQTAIPIDDVAMNIVGQSLFGNDIFVVSVADTIVISPKALVILSTDTIVIPAGSIVFTGRQFKVDAGRLGGSSNFLNTIGKFMGR